MPLTEIKRELLSSSRWPVGKWLSLKYVLCFTSHDSHGTNMCCALQLSKAGRLDTNVISTLQNTADVMDFAFDPFNSRRVVIGTC